MNPSSPLRWAIKQAENWRRHVAAQSGNIPVSADFEGKLAKAHLAADRAEEIEQEHFALRLGLHALLKSARPREGVQCGSDAFTTYTLKGSDLESARQILNAIKP